MKGKLFYADQSIHGQNGERPRECLIFEVCQPQQAKKVLDENMSVSTALPCRISIYEEGGKTILATHLHTHLRRTRFPRH